MFRLSHAKNSVLISVKVSIWPEQENYCASYIAKTFVAHEEAASITFKKFQIISNLQSEKDLFQLKGKENLRCLGFKFYCEKLNRAAVRCCRPLPPQQRKNTPKFSSGQIEISKLSKKIDKLFIVCFSDLLLWAKWQLNHDINSLQPCG